MILVHIVGKASRDLQGKLSARKVNNHPATVEDRAAGAHPLSHYRPVLARRGAGETQRMSRRAHATLKADLVTMRDDTTAGRQAIVKGEGMTMAGTARGALVEVIALEAGFGTLCLRFNDLGGLRLRLVHEGRLRHEDDQRFPYTGLLFGLILAKVTTALHGVRRAR
jgi:hypothetical protein